MPSRFKMKCKNCGEIFYCTNKRTTCSHECLSMLRARVTEERRKNIAKTASMWVGTCAVCEQVFRSKYKRKTCSDRCHAALSSERGAKHQEELMARGRPNDPTPEEIAHQCALIRAGVLVIREFRTIKEREQCLR